jgi:hypothetical protein
MAVSIAIDSPPCPSDIPSSVSIGLTNSYVATGTVDGLMGAADVGVDNMRAFTSYNGTVKEGTCLSVTGTGASRTWKFTMPVLPAWSGQTVWLVVKAYPTDNSTPAVQMCQPTLGIFAEPPGAKAGRQQGRKGKGGKKAKGAKARE